MEESESEDDLDTSVPESLSASLLLLLLAEFWAHSKLQTARAKKDGQRAHSTKDNGNSGPPRKPPRGNGESGQC
jgi:hypothetical protein